MWIYSALNLNLGVECRYKIVWCIVMLNLNLIASGHQSLGNIDIFYHNIVLNIRSIIHSTFFPLGHSGNVIANPLAVYRHATNALNEEDLLELDLEEGMEAEEVTEGEGEEWEDEEDEEGEEASDSDEGSLSNIDEESEHAEEDSM